MDKEAYILIRPVAPATPTLFQQAQILLRRPKDLLSFKNILRTSQQRLCLLE